MRRNWLVTCFSPSRSNSTLRLPGSESLSGDEDSAHKGAGTTAARGTGAAQARRGRAALPSAGAGNTTINGVQQGSSQRAEPGRLQALEERESGQAASVDDSDEMGGTEGGANRQAGGAGGLEGVRGRANGRGGAGRGGGGGGEGDERSEGEDELVASLEHLTDPDEIKKVKR